MVRSALRRRESALLRGCVLVPSPLPLTLRRVAALLLVSFPVWRVARWAWGVVDEGSLGLAL